MTACDDASQLYVNRSSKVRSGRQQRHSTDQRIIHAQITRGKQPNFHPEGRPWTRNLQLLWAEWQQPWFLHWNSSLAIYNAAHQRPWYELLNVDTDKRALTATNILKQYSDIQNISRMPSSISQHCLSDFQGCCLSSLEFLFVKFTICFCTVDKAGCAGALIFWTYQPVKWSAQVQYNCNTRIFSCTAVVLHLCRPLQYKFSTTCRLLAAVVKNFIAVVLRLCGLLQYNKIFL